MLKAALLSAPASVPAAGITAVRGAPLPNCNTNTRRTFMITMLKAALLSALTAASTAAPLPNTNTNTVGGVAIGNLERAFDEKLGRRRRDDFESVPAGTDPAVDTALSFIVVTNGPAASAAMCAEAPASGCSCDYTYSNLLHGLAVTCTLGQLEPLLAAHSAEVLEAEASLEVHIAEVQSDATWGLDRIDKPNLPLDQSYEHESDGGAGVKVFVIDSGVRCTHAEFGSRCIRGWGAGWSGNVCPEGVSECANDFNGHGSHCAGSIGGATWGVAKGTTIVGVQVIDAYGGGELSDIVGGLDWVAGQKMADPSTPMVASMSLGIGGGSDLIDAAVNRLNSAGVTVSVAAGNNNDDACKNSPGRTAGAVTVGSTDSRDARSSFSNYGGCVDIYGPGSEITSVGIASDTASTTMSGTSMACPHVAGVLALIKARAPKVTSAEATSILIQNAVTGKLSNGAVPNVMLQSNIGPITRAPTGEGETWSPTGSPTPTPTGAPTVPRAVHMGPIACGESKNGDTTNHGNIIGNLANDATFSFVVSWTSSFEFSACGSSFDTVVRILDANNTDVASGDDDGDCGVQTVLQVPSLAPGSYTLVVEGYSSAAGAFTITMNGANGGECPGGNGLTPPPTTPPTTTTYCPAGYTDLPTRFNLGVGRITITSSHQACADRCTTFAHLGCHGYQTGMYNGALFCRSYGGNVRTVACASWADPAHPGVFSGQLGDVHPRTIQENVGGSCCTRIAAL